MVRLFAVAVSAGMFLATGIAAQQPTSVGAGKWEVAITGQPTRVLELAVDGSTVTGTLTKDGSATAVGTGEFKDNSLTSQTKARDEFFIVALKNGGLHGTYVYGGASKDVHYNTGVIVKRPAR